MGKEEVFSHITSLLLEYEIGDFLLLSDLSDAVNNLNDFYLDIEEAHTLIQMVLKCIRTEMNASGTKDFAQMVSNSLDLLQTLENSTTPEQRRSVLERISTFTCGSPQKSKKNIEKAISCDEETLQVFLTEVTDRLGQAQTIILDLENDLQNGELIQILFRIFHTIKGECGFLKIATLGELTHNIESILDGIRNNKITMNSQYIDILLEGIDLSKKIVDRLKAHDFVMFSDVSMDSYIARLQSSSPTQGDSLGTILVNEGKLKETDVVKILQKQKESAFTRRFGEIAVKENYLTSDELQDTLSKQKEKKDSPTEKKTEHVDPVIKVKASKVTFLVDMIGELLIAMGQLSENSPAVTQMKKITRSLQFGAMELRTETVQSLFGNIKRVVRDLSKQLDKPIHLDVSGESLEIDRNLIEKLEEPLMHLVRNSLDHGIESAEDRTSAGKNSEGTISLQAERLGNSIMISVRDDGAGLDRKKIIEKAIEKNLVRCDVAETMTDAQVFNLIFTSGFSTNEVVTLVSGRGVGMDIVRQVVQENRGRIEIESEVGKFTECRLIFPLSTAIIDGMITRVSDNLFIFPIGSVVESVKVLPSMISTVNGKVEVMDLRGEAILVLRMHSVFEIEDTSSTDMKIGVIVENSERRKFMLLLDEVIAKREVVIKTLGNRFKTMRGITSGTVLSGGKIGLVVDVDQIVDLSLLEAFS